VTEFESHEQTAIRDIRIHQVLDEVLNDVAMWLVATDLGEDEATVAKWQDAGYQRLYALDRYDMARAVMLLLGESGDAEERAEDILHGLRKATS
jgi:hypothetical protein